MRVTFDHGVANWSYSFVVLHCICIGDVLMSLFCRISNMVMSCFKSMRMSLSLFHRIFQLPCMLFCHYFFISNLLSQF